MNRGRLRLKWFETLDAALERRRLARQFRFRESDQGPLRVCLLYVFDRHCRLWGG